MINTRWKQKQTQSEKSSKNLPSPGFHAEIVVAGVTLAGGRVNGGEGGDIVGLDVIAVSRLEGTSILGADCGEDLIGTVNGGGLRCRGGECEPCYGNFRTSGDDDCLTDTEARAWSSPIFLQAGSQP